MSLTSRCALLVALVLSPTLVERSAWAQDRGNKVFAPGDLALAEAHFKLGKAHLDAGNFDEAVNEFRQAYSIAQADNVFFFLGEAYRLKDDRRAAIENYQKYVVAKPNGQKADEARRRIAELTRAIKEDEAKATEAAAANAIDASKAKPAPAPVAKPEPKPAPAPAPVAKAEPKPAPVPVAKPEPKPAPAPLPVAKAEPKPAPDPVAKPEPKPAPAPSVEEVPKAAIVEPTAEAAPAGDEKPAPKSSRKWLAVTLGVVGGLVLAGAAVGIAFVLPNDAAVTTDADHTLRF